MTKQTRKRKICVIDGCNSPFRTRNLCRNHYANFIYAQKQNKFDDPAAFIKAYNAEQALRNANTICHLDDCTQPIDSKNLCTLHYSQFFRYGVKTGLKDAEKYIQKRNSGTLDVVPRRMRAVKLCSVDGCTRKHRSVGLCERHYAQKRRDEKG